MCKACNYLVHLWRGFWGTTPHYYTPHHAYHVWYIQPLFSASAHARSECARREADES